MYPPRWQCWIASEARGVNCEERARMAEGENFHSKATKAAEMEDRTEDRSLYILCHEVPKALG
jgi:hypothetical protein